MRAHPRASAVAVVEALEVSEAGVVSVVVVAALSEVVEDSEVDSVAASVVPLALELALALALDLEPRVSRPSLRCLRTLSLTLRRLMESGLP